MSGFNDLFIKRKVAVDAFVTISLLATMAIGDFLSAAIVIFIMAIAGAVVKVIPDAKSAEEEILSLVASTEKYSDHPLAKAIVASTTARGISIEEPKEFSSETGIGVMAKVKDASVYVGRFDYMMENNFTIPIEIEKAFINEEEQSRTCIVVAKNKNVIGLISLADEIRPETNDAITELNKLIGNPIHRKNVFNDRYKTVLRQRLWSVLPAPPSFRRDRVDGVASCLRAGLLEGNLHAGMLPHLIRRPLPLL